MMFGKFIRALAFAVAFGTPTLVQAQQLIGGYVANAAHPGRDLSRRERPVHQGYIDRQVTRR
jgi:hypothetical protein